MVIKRVEVADTRLSGILLAVADGHGGDETSSYVAQQLTEGAFDRMLISHSKDFTDALTRLFQYLNASTLEMSRKTKAHYESGTTLSVVYVPDVQNKLYVGVIGDSPVILARNVGIYHVSPEHNARSNKEERKAAEQRGGLFDGNYLFSPHTRMGLQMTRDIGCHSMGDILRRYPDIYDLEIHVGDVLIVGSDGLLDPSHGTAYEDEITRLVKLVMKGAGAQELVTDALQRETGDNVSAIVYKR